MKFALGFFAFSPWIAALIMLFDMPLRAAVQTAATTLFILFPFIVLGLIAGMYVKTRPSKAGADTPAIAPTTWMSIL